MITSITATTTTITATSATMNNTPTLLNKTEIYKGNKITEVNQ
jgi:hypothetical protein